MRAPVGRLVAPAALAAWCRRWLGSTPASILFETGNLSQVTGLRLEDGREVVVKARPAARRLAGCVCVQQHLWAAGFPCPRPLAGPEPLEGLAATAEELIGGIRQDCERADGPQRFAVVLAELIAAAPPPGVVPTLRPPPAWLAWDHAGPRTWPRPASTPADLNEFRGPAQIDSAARRTRWRLHAVRADAVIGHGDFESQNVYWSDGRLSAVHDWDSAVAAPEAAIVGAAAAVFPADGPAGRAATLVESTTFLEHYERARGNPFTSDEREAAWAAGLWTLAYKCKIEAVEGGSDLFERLGDELPERLERAGA